MKKMTVHVHDGDEFTAADNTVCSWCGRVLGLDIEVMPGTSCNLFCDIRCATSFWVAA